MVEFKIKFKNKNSETFQKLKENKITVISYNIEINYDTISKDVSRVTKNVLLDDKKTFADMKIKSIDFDEGSAIIIVYDDKHNDIMNSPNARLFINSINSTAITHFTIMEVI